ncbi:Telomerase protein component 1 [Cichlidogyrus casuarinus]|uniref:Telomerase protein component 1 n=1 Tax=Cichlidogyrus casuarinus TaxID=1844966 RepID=A0ABD2QDP7_9PLAT
MFKTKEKSLGSYVRDLEAKNQNRFRKPQVQQAAVPQNICLSNKLVEEEKIKFQKRNNLKQQDATRSKKEQTKTTSKIAKIDIPYQNVAVRAVPQTIEEHPLWNAFEVKKIPSKFNAETKSQFIQVIASSLISGSLVKNPKLLQRSGLPELFNLCADYDPEFVFKAMVYCRKELFIRSTTNYMYVRAAQNEALRPYLMKYTSAVIALPSDWLDVIDTYQKLSNALPNRLQLPSALRKALMDKFKEFDEYQLAKYNNEGLVKRRERKRIRDEKNNKTKKTKNVVSSSSSGSSLDLNIFGKSDSEAEECEDVQEEQCQTTCYRDLAPEMRMSSMAFSSPFAAAPLQPITPGYVQFGNVLPESFSRVRNIQELEEQRQFSPSLFSFVQRGQENEELEQIPSLFDDIQMKETEIDHLELPEGELEISDERGTEMKRVAFQIFTMKKLIRSLHMSEPHEFVMGLLGKKYPSTFEEFIESKLPGTWDASRKGERMSLKTPYTWETEVSQRGNKREVWEQLIESEKLPYMACLRNLRNIVLAGVSEKHQAMVEKLLTDEKLVANSKQMPIQFFTAYRVLQEMLKAKKELQQKIREVYKAKLKKKNIRIPAKTIQLSSLVTTKTRKLQTASSFFIGRLLKAIIRAMEISLSHNLPSIRGRTLIICMHWFEFTMDKIVKESATRYLLAAMCMVSCEDCESLLVSSNGDKCLSLNHFIRSNLLEDANFMHCMQRISRMSTFEMDLEKHLDELLSKRKKFDAVVVIGEPNKSVLNYVSTYRQLIGPVFSLANPEKINTSYPDWMMVNGYSDQIIRFLSERGDEKLLSRIENMDKIYGLAHKPVRTRHDNSSKVGPERGAQMAKLRSCVNQVPPDLNLCHLATKFRTSQIFISSTFKDMHAERDLICGVIIPAVRKSLFAKKQAVQVNEIDLRWGIPEQETQTKSSLCMCMELAESSEVFVLLIGARYGWIPSKELVESLPEHIKSKVDKFYQPGMSVTEMEFHMACLNTDPSMLNQKVMVFIRNYASIETVPTKVKPYFVESTREPKLRLQALMKKVREMGLVQMDRYPASYSQVIDGKPCMGNLNELAEAMTSCLINTLVSNVPQFSRMRSHSIESGTIVSTGIASNSHVFSGLNQIGSKVSLRHYRDLLKIISNDVPRRGTQIASQRYSAAANSSSSYVDKKAIDGCIIFLTGCPGSGKSTLLAALASRLRYPEWEPLAVKSGGAIMSRVVDLEDPVLNNPHEVFIHWLSNISEKHELTRLLDRAIAHLVRCVEALRPGHLAPLVENLDALIDEYEAAVFNTNGAISLESKLLVQKPFFERLINYMGKHDSSRHYSFLVDSGDMLYPQSCLDWIPEVLPKNVTFFISCNTGTAYLKKMSQRADALLYRLSALSSSERSALIRSVLAAHGKMLNENALKNQMSQLVNKRDAGIPLFLKLACEHLRLQGQYEELDNQLKSIPSTIPKLMSSALDHLSDKFGLKLVKAMLGFSFYAKRPLHTTEMLHLMQTWLNLDLEESQTRVTPLAFYSLVAGLQMIYCGLDDQEEDKSTLDSGFRGLLTVRTPEVAHLVQMYLEGKLSDLAAEDGSSFTTSFFKNDPKKDTNAAKLEKFKINIFSTLATELDDPKNEIYYLTKAGKLTEASKRLCNFGYLMKRFEAIGQKKQDEASLIRDFSGYLDDDDWLSHPHLKVLKEVVLRNLHILVKFPALLPELCMNQIQSNLKMPSDKTSYIPSTHPDEDYDVYDLSEEIRKTLIQIKEGALKYAQVMEKITQTGEFGEDSPDEGIGEDSKINVKMSLDEIVSICARKRRFLRSCPLPSSGQLMKPSSFVSLEGYIDQNATAICNSQWNKLIAYGTEKGAIIVSHLETGLTLDSFFGHTDAIQQICFIPLQASTSIETFHEPVESLLTQIDNYSLVLCSASLDGSVIIWQMSSEQDTSGKQLVRLQSRQGFTSCAYSIIDRTLALGNLDGRVSLWNMPHDVKEISNMRNPRSRIKTTDSKVTCLAFRLGSHHYLAEFDPDLDDTLAVGCWDGSIRILNMKHTNKQHVAMVHRRAVCSVAFSTDPRRSLFASMNVLGEVILCRADSYKILTRIASDNPVKGVLGFFALPYKSMFGYRGKKLDAFQSNQVLYHSGGEAGASGRISLWNASLGSLVSHHAISKISLRGNSSRICAQCVDPLGRLRFYAHENGTFSVVDAQAPNVRLGKLQISVTPLDVNKHGIIRFLDCTKVDQNVYLILAITDYGTQVLLRMVRTECTVSDPLVNVYNSSALKLTKQVVDMTSDQWQMTQVCFIPKNQLQLASTVSQASIHMTLDNAAFICIGFSDGMLLTQNVILTKSQTKWQSGSITVESPSKFYNHSGEITCISFCEGFIATGSKDCAIALYLLADRKCQALCVVSKAHEDWITAMCHIGKDWLATGGNESKICLWTDISSGQTPRKVLTLSQHVSGILKLSSLDNLLFSASSDGQLAVWKFATLQPGAQLECDYPKSKITYQMRKGQVQNTKSTKTFTAYKNNASNAITAELLTSINFMATLNGISDESAAEFDVLTIQQIEAHLPLSYLIYQSTEKSTLPENAINARDTGLDGNELNLTELFTSRLLTKQEALISDLEFSVSLTRTNLDGERRMHSVRFAAFQPRLRGFLEGHPGSPAVSIATSLQKHCKVNLLVAGGKDQPELRKFILDADMETKEGDMNLFHNGEVTAIAVASLQDVGDSPEGDFLAWAVTGSTDGSLIVWRLFQALYQEDDDQELVTSSLEINAEWRPYFQLFCESTTAIGSIKIRSESIVSHAIFWSQGCTLFRLQFGVHMGAPWPLDELKMPLKTCLAKLSVKTDAHLTQLTLPRVITALTQTNTEEMEEVFSRIYAIDVAGNVNECSFGSSESFKGERIDSSKDATPRMLLNLRQGGLMVLAGGELYHGSGIESWTKFCQIKNRESLMFVSPCWMPDKQVATYQQSHVHISVKEWQLDEEDNFCHVIQLDLGEENDPITCKIYSRITAVHYVGVADRVRKNANASSALEFCKALILVIATAPDYYVHVLECCAPVLGGLRRALAPKTKVIAGGLMDRRGNPGARKQVKIAAPTSVSRACLWNQAEWMQASVYPTDNVVTHLASFCQNRYNASGPIDLLVATKTGDVQTYKVL